MNNIKLRALTETDAQFLSIIMNIDAVLNILNERPTQLEDWVNAIKVWSKDDDEEVYIICDGETPIGWIGINNLESEDKVAYLKMVAILPCYHNQGIGYNTINEIIKILQQRKFVKIALYTDQENHQARACYSKCGFKVTKTFMDQMANGKTVSRCMMELSL